MPDHPGRFLAVLVYLYYFIISFYFTLFPVPLGIAVSPCPILFPLPTH